MTRRASLSRLEWLLESLFDTRLGTTAVAVGSGTVGAGVAGVVHAVSTGVGIRAATLWLLTVILGGGLAVFVPFVPFAPEAADGFFGQQPD